MRGRSILLSIFFGLAKAVILDIINLLNIHVKYSNQHFTVFLDVIGTFFGRDWHFFGYGQIYDGLKLKNIRFFINFLNKNCMSKTKNSEKAD